MLDQLAINSNTYHGFSLEEAVKGAREAGFRNIKLAAVRDHTAHVLPEMSSDEILRIRKLLDESGLKCVGISSHSNVMTEEGVANLVKGIDLAMSFECRHVTTATGDSHGDKNVIDDLVVLIENLLPAG